MLLSLAQAAGLLAFEFLCLAELTATQLVSPPSTWPQNYTGIPVGWYSPEWQDYFEVTVPLPNVTAPPLPRSFAGNIAVNRPGHPNDTLFFWGFEKEPGSLTVAANERNDEPWLIWLNGGPGVSSLFGFMAENGPLHITNDYSIVKNPYSWNRLADAFWVDNPVGVGFSTADRYGYVADEDQMGEDFIGFLSNLVLVFPSLAKRPLYITGESYGGIYIPYITKTYFNTPYPPAKLKKISIGDGTLAAWAVFEELATLAVIETYPEIIGFDPEVYDYFKEQTHLCGYDLNLTYPQNGLFPTLFDPFAASSTENDPRSGNFGSPKRARQISLHAAVKKRFAERYDEIPAVLGKRDIAARERKRTQWKRDLTGRANGTLDPYYGCFLWDEMVDYATNFTFPWTLGGFDAYDVPDGLNPESPTSNTDSSAGFFNDNRTRTALHAPTSQNWTGDITYPFGSEYSYQIGQTNVVGDPSPPSMNFLSELAANASAQGISMLFYSGNDDSLVSRRGTEVTIQNMTFGGIQGFTRRPSTPWYDDYGNFAGIVHQERNVTWVLFTNAGHEVPQYVPEAAYYYLREFVLGSNPTGLVVDNSTAVGGEDASLAGEIVPGTSVIFYGSGTTTASSVAPSASLAYWSSFLATATPVPSPLSGREL